MMRLVLLLLLPACELFLPAPTIDGDGGRPDRDACSDDGDCDEDEECSRGRCVPIGEGEGEGEGEPPPPPPPTCGDVGCPEILSFSSNRATLGPADSATLSAVVTDPDGAADLLGGVLLDPATTSTYGTFTATGAGTFSIPVDWQVLGAVRPIDFTTQGTRVVRARFFDQGGHETFQDLPLTLACDDGDAACDGGCGRVRCDGVCEDPRSFNTADHCGACDARCDPPGICDFDAALETFRCSGGGEGEGEGESPPGTPYVGNAERGVVCADAGTCADSCCLDFVTSAATCVAEGGCLFGDITCDGPEDCATNEECCSIGLGASCLPEGECRANGYREVCVDSDDCRSGELCCAATLGLGVSLDVGMCEVAQDGQCPTLDSP